jgi:SH3 domain-containing YSC84-like protein 1
VKLGPDVSIAAGPIGAGAKADIITDMVSYAHSKGIYGGLNLEGTVVAISNDWNETYYNKNPLTAVYILVRGGVRTKGADKPLGDVSRAASKK